MGVSDGTQSDSAHFSTHTRMLVPFVQGLDTGAAAMQKGALAEYRDDSFQSSGTVRLSTQERTTFNWGGPSDELVLTLLAQLASLLPRPALVTGWCWSGTLGLTVSHHVVGLTPGLQLGLRTDLLLQALLCERASDDARER